MYYTLMDWMLKYKMAEQGFKVLAWFGKVPIKYMIKGFSILKGMVRAFAGAKVGKKAFFGLARLLVLLKSGKIRQFLWKLLTNPLKWFGSIAVDFFTKPRKIGGATIAFGTYMVARAFGVSNTEFLNAAGWMAKMIKDSGVFGVLTSWWTNNFTASNVGMFLDQLQMWKKMWNDGSYGEMALSMVKGTSKVAIKLFKEITIGLGGSFWGGIVRPILIEIFDKIKLPFMDKPLSAYVYKEYYNKKYLSTHASTAQNALLDFSEYNEREKASKFGLYTNIGSTKETRQNRSIFENRYKELTELNTLGAFGTDEKRKSRVNQMLIKMKRGRISKQQFESYYKQLMKWAEQSEKENEKYEGYTTGAAYRESWVEYSKERKEKVKKESDIFYSQIKKDQEKEMKKLGLKTSKDVNEAAKNIKKSMAATADSVTDAFLEGYTGSQKAGSELKSKLSKKLAVVGTSIKNFGLDDLEQYMPSLAGYGIGSSLGGLGGDITGLPGMSFDGGNGKITLGHINGKRSITYPNGVTKYDGSRSWRTNNPGNLGGHEKSCPKLLKKYAKYGVLGCDHPGDKYDSKWRALVFRTMDGGQAARRDLILKSYGNYTILTIGEKYQKGKSAFVYGSNILKNMPLKVNPNKPIRSFSEAEINSFLIGMMKAEGFWEGKTKNGGQTDSSKSSGINGINHTTSGVQQKSWENAASGIKNFFGGMAGGSASTVSNAFFGGGSNFTISAEDGNVAAQVAKKYADQGIAYVWGAGRGSDAQSGLLNGATSYDCSSFVAMVVNKTYGIPINKFGSTVATQYAFLRSGGGTPVPYNKIQPGDLIYIWWGGVSVRNPGHTGVAIGNGKMVHASGGQTRTGYYKAGNTGVITGNLPPSNKVKAFRLNSNAKNHVTGTVMPTTGSDQMFVPGVGMVSNGGNTMSDFQTQLNSIASQLLGISGEVADVVQENSKRVKDSLSGDISLDKCQL